MGRATTLGTLLAWPLLLPGSLATRAMGVTSGEAGDLVRMLVNGLVWTGIGIVGIALAL